RIALTRSAGCIGVEVEGERARSAVTIDLMRMEVAAEGEAVPALRPRHSVSGDNRGAREVALERVSDEGLLSAIHPIAERDDREVGRPGIAETELLRPITAGSRRVPLIIEVVGKVQHVEDIGRERMRFARPKLIGVEEVDARRRKRSAVGTSCLPHAAAVYQRSRFVVVDPRSRQMVPLADDMVQLYHHLVW